MGCELLPAEKGEAMVQIARGWVAYMAVGAVIVATAGCSPTATDQSTKAPQAVSKAKPAASVETLTVDALRIKIGDYMPPLEEGQLKIAAPVGWDWERPGKGFLVGFCQENSSLNNLPRILVSVEDSPLPGIEKLDEENVGELVDHVAGSLAGKEPAEPVKPIILSGAAWVRYVDYAKKGNALVARQTLKTIASGRLYTVRLDVYAAQLEKFRHAAFAVAASMKFSAQAAQEESPAKAARQDEPA